MNSKAVTNSPSDAEGRQPLWPWAFVSFLVVAMLWLVMWLTPITWQTPQWLMRSSGYLAVLFLLAPFLHVFRRMFRYRHWGRMSDWLWWHIVGSNASFFFLLIHCNAQAGSGLTLELLVLAWLVMISGIGGFYGQKLLYRQLAFSVTREVGRAELDGERKKLEASAMGLIEDSAKLLESADADSEQSHTSIAAATQRFLERSLKGSLSRPFPSLGWLFSPAALARKSDNNLTRAREIITDQRQFEIVDELFKLMELRRQLDIEYSIHRLAHCWLFAHGTAAWAFILLVAVHVLVSIWFGGFF